MSIIINIIHGGWLIVNSVRRAVAAVCLLFFVACSVGAAEAKQALPEGMGVSDAKAVYAAVINAREEAKHRMLEISAKQSEIKKAEAEARDAELKAQLQENQQKLASYSEDQKKLIARVVYAESRGEPFEGQVAVARVVLNRYESGLFGSSLKRILRRSQFAMSKKYNEQCMEAVEAAILTDEYPDDMFFFQVSKRKNWRNFIYYSRIGSHSFYLAGE